MVDSVKSATLDALEALEGVNEWFGQRAAGEPATNAEEAIFQRVHQSLNCLSDALGALSETSPTSGEA